MLSPKRILGPNKYWVQNKCVSEKQFMYKQAGAELCQAQGKLKLFWP